jgi:hypothetical protein
MCEHKRSVASGENVEFEHVATELDGKLERLQRVLRRKRRRTSVADPREMTARAAKLNQRT